MLNSRRLAILSPPFFEFALPAASHGAGVDTVVQTAGTKKRPASSEAGKKESEDLLFKYVLGQQELGINQNNKLFGFWNF